MSDTPAIDRLRDLHGFLIRCAEKAWDLQVSEKMATALNSRHAVRELLDRYDAGELEDDLDRLAALSSVLAILVRDAGYLLPPQVTADLMGNLDAAVRVLESAGYFQGGTP